VSEICDRLRDLRQQHGLSLRAFAEVLQARAAYEVSHDSARRYESGDGRIPAEFVSAVCRSFAVSADWLLLGAENGADSPSLVASALREIAHIVERARGMGSAFAPQESLPVVRAEWKRFIRGLPPAHRLRTAIIESWQRSRAAGVDPTPQRPTLRRVSERELARRLASTRPMIDAAAPHLAWLSALVGDAPHVVYLVCSDGIVLHSVSNDHDLRSTWGLEPGYDWSETTMGTNGAGTAVATGKVVAVLGPEHYAQQFHGAACLAAPLHNAGGDVMGAVDLSMSVERCLTERLALVAYVADRIEHDFQITPLD